MQLRLFNTSGPRCLDGTTAGYYVDSAAGSGRGSMHGGAGAQVVVWLEGGGACFSEDDCEQRAKGDLGSSKGWSQSMTPNSHSHGLLSTDADVNPDFGGFLHVYVPYCSGDVWYGDAPTALNPWAAERAAAPARRLSKVGWEGYFQGHLIVQAVLDDLFGGSGSSVYAQPPSELVLTGCSAGGIGTFGNCDYVAKQFPGARVVCRPEAGYFGLPIKTYKTYIAGLPDHDMHHISNANWTQQVISWVKTEPTPMAACVADGSAWVQPDDDCDGDEELLLCCHSPPYFMPYIETPLFVSEATADAYQVFTQGAAPEEDTPQVVAYVEYLRGILSGSLERVVARGKRLEQNGLFAPACLQHCMSWNGSSAGLVQGKDLQEAFGDWYNGRAKGAAAMLLDNNTGVSTKC